VALLGEMHECKWLSEDVEERDYSRDLNIDRMIIIIKIIKVLNGV
jgi:hypothetical protein